MKKLISIVCLALTFLLNAQSDFLPEEYIQFRQENKNINAETLIQQNPAPFTYYNSRTYPTDLSKVSWLDSIDQSFHLSSAEKTMISEQHFMVSERLTSYTWLDAFARIYSDDLPVFLSTDFFLFTLHQSYDEILKMLEYEILEPNLNVLLQTMYNYFPTLYADYADEEKILPSLADVDLYLAVALSLIQDAEVLPHSMEREKYDEVMSAIEAEQMVEMPLFTKETRDRKIDFSQFTARGHYTDIIYTSQGQHTLEKYFKAMMWLGRIDFLLTAPPENPWESDWTDEELLRMNLSALLLNEVLHHSGEKQLLDKHEGIIEFMVGPDDNMNANELEALRRDSMKMNSPKMLLSETEFARWKKLINSSDDFGQKIMSNFFYVDPEANDPGALPVSFKLLGQKFLIDSYVFSEVVYDRIQHQGEKIFRGLPDPLDMLSVMGSPSALELMKVEMDSFKYAYKVNELKYLVDSYDEEYWTQSLYNTWLSAIKELNPPEEDSKLPYFMRTVAWQHEKLTTQLTSWAQLRHDNILYGKQSYTGGTGCSFPYSYVEPYPEFYRSLANFAENAALFFEDVLAEKTDVRERVCDYYDRYGEIMLILKGVADKELAKKGLTNDEIAFMKTMINSYMSSGPSVTGWINDLLFNARDMWDFDFTVADVHTQPTNETGQVVGNVLHVGNGLINLGVFIAPENVNHTSLMAYVGPVSSFHTSVQNNFKRLNDIEWEELFRSSKYPERPKWTRNYLLNELGESIATDKALKGVAFEGTNLEENISNPLSYFICYPNPAETEVRLRFILQEKAEVKLELYDICGKRISSVFRGELPAAEHDFIQNLEWFQSGIYFSVITIDGRPYTQKVILK